MVIENDKLGSANRQRTAEELLMDMTFANVCKAVMKQQDDVMHELLLYVNGEDKDLDTKVRMLMIKHAVDEWFKLEALREMSVFKWDFGNGESTLDEKIYHYRTV